MINPLIRWSLHNRAAVLVIATLLCLVGGATALRMPVDVFPDLTAPTVTVITEAHGMAPSEVENQVTFPIEAALNGAAGVRRVRSSTAVGISVVWVEFDWGEEIHRARQIVNEKLALVAGDMPPEVGRPTLAPVSSIMGEILFLSLTSDRHDPVQLRTVASTSIRRRLLSVPGVSQVTPIGGGVKQYQVMLDPERLRSHGVFLDEVLDALRRSNENVSAGFLNEGGTEYLIEGIGRVRSTDDIARTVVVARGGAPVRVANLGRVRIGEAPKRGEGSANGRPAVILGVQKQPGANTLTLTRALDGVLDGIESELPEGMKLDRHIFRQSEFIRIAVENVLHALRDGAVLVVVIVLLFLANARSTLITLTAIPLSLLAAVLTLRAFGATINTMTLGGMAIAIGALVDDAVIDVENVFRRLRENAKLPPDRRRPTRTVVYDASVEIRTSIVFATFIIALVFLPLFFMSGVEGRLMAPLGMAYVVSILVSLVVALTVTPALCHLLLPNSRAVLSGEEPAVVRWLKGAYARILGPALRHPLPVTLPAVLLLGIAIPACAFMGRSFLPEFNEGSLTISAVTLPGTSLAESDALGRIVEETLMSHPEIVSVARRTGRAELDEHAQGVEAAELDVSLRMQGRGKSEFLAALRESLTLVPGMNITIGQPISHRIDHMLSGTRANIAIKLFGPDLYRLRKLAERVREGITGVEGVVDLSVEPQMDIPTLRVRFDRHAIARHGLRIEEIAHALESALQGLPVSRILEGSNAFDLVVRMGREGNWSLETIGHLPVDTPSGAKVPLHTLARIVREVGPNTISREQVERKIVVMCNVADRDVASVVADCRERIAPILTEATGYRVEYGGQFESAQEATRILALLGLAVVAGIGFLLHLAFGSGRDALFVMLNLPLALIGGVAGVYLSGGVLSVASLIGFITVFGIATRNGIMLVSHIQHLQREEGVTDFREAVFRGSMERLAPILMTALAASLALVPLALGGGKPGNEIQTPMAIVILSGITTSMLLNMVVVPTLYLRFGRPVVAKQGGDV
ncbi:MAG: efflux RND transporter permease subunit [Planctomycetes bacterium]|nr:efflux RND transporter permease subunit [Planctomycetota bacterium]